LRVEHKDDFASTIKKALDNTGVTIVEVVFAYPQKVE